MAIDASRMAITELKGVGPQLAERLSRLHVATVQDLLFHLPMRYEDRTRVVPIGSLSPGQSAVIEGEVELSEIAFRGRRSWLVRVSDGTGSITLRFFHFSKAQTDALQRGQRLRVFGEARRGKLMLEMVHPEYRAMSDDVAPAAETLTPVYPATEGINQGRLRALTTQALNRLERGQLAISEWLPPDTVANANYPSLRDAIRYVHRPPADADVALLASGRHPAQRRLAFEELLAHHLSLRQLRAAAEQLKAEAMTDTGTATQFLAQLPFALTVAQQRVCAEIRNDLARQSPMMRLVQGDVGSGKTVVAAYAAMIAVAAGRQVAVMAPTEILAEQHFRLFDQWCRNLPITVAWLSGKLTAAQQRTQLQAIEAGDAAIVIGTHALFQERVQFRKLGLVIIDEQHRFGVHQRLALRDKGANGDLLPHQLIMTATPIPRTLAMTAYADLDVSVIDELPPGRTPVTTVVLPDSRRADVVQRVDQAIAEGRQVYWVCPLVEESELLQYEAAEATVETLRAALPAHRIALVHGRMKPAEKEAVMSSFKRGEHDLLVATTVIEVGVDIPNASLMVVENAERMGLAQLHQLRGRVGRGATASSCVLMYRAPLSQMARRRLQVMRETTDGFVIAQQDLEMRGPGEVLGTRQTGVTEWQIADLVRDADMLPFVQKLATTLLASHPENVQALIERWLGDASRYAQA